MDRRAKNPLLVLLLLLVLSCLLVYPPSPPPPHPVFFGSMPRSLRLGSQKLTSSQETTIGAAMNLGRPEARMDLDYPTPGANDDNDPGHGGRA